MLFSGLGAQLQRADVGPRPSAGLGVHQGRLKQGERFLRPLQQQQGLRDCAARLQNRIEILFLLSEVKRGLKGTQRFRQAALVAAQLAQALEGAGGQEAAAFDQEMGPFQQGACLHEVAVTTQQIGVVERHRSLSSVQSSVLRQLQRLCRAGQGFITHIEGVVGPGEVASHRRCARRRRFWGTRLRTQQVLQRGVEASQIQVNGAEVAQHDCRTLMVLRRFTDRERFFEVQQRAGTVATGMFQTRQAVERIGECGGIVLSPGQHHHLFKEEDGPQVIFPP